MFKRILIIEDIDSISLGITTLLEKNLASGVSITNTKYCDEAYLKIRKAINENIPFDLVITDLSFKKNHREVKLASGEDFIRAIKKEQHDIRIIVYSVEDRHFIIKSLLENYGVDSYVTKGRESSSELLEAINAVSNNETPYVSPHLVPLLKENTFLEIEEYDVLLMKHLSLGLTQEQISMRFRKQGTPSSSTSSIEKRINRLKIFFKANNTIHLVSIAKDMGII